MRSREQGVSRVAHRRFQLDVIMMMVIIIHFSNDGLIMLYDNCHDILCSQMIIKRFMTVGHCVGRIAAHKQILYNLQRSIPYAFDMHECRSQLNCNASATPKCV